MKKYLSMLLISLIVISMTACNNSDKKEGKTISQKLKDAGYKEIVSGEFKKEKDKNFFIISVKEKTITFNNEEKDYQIEYSITNDDAWMYGCRYHYADKTTTNDGEGFGECNDKTINQLIEGKEKIDEELKSSNITIDELK